MKIKLLTLAFALAFGAGMGIASGSSVALDAPPSGTNCRNGEGNFVRAPANRPPLRIALTFDDGTTDHIEVVAPLLAKHGWKGTFNIVTDTIGKPKRMTWDDIRELRRRGHEIASHTATHPDLKSLLAKGETNEVRRQYRESREAIRREVGKAPAFMCYPFSERNAATDALCREEGMEPMLVERRNFGKGTKAGTPTGVGAVIDGWLAEGREAMDVLVHGVKPGGGWCPFDSEADYAAFLDEVADRERKGLVKVVSYAELLATGAEKRPYGLDGRQAAGWKLAFADEFGGTKLNESDWDDWVWSFQGRRQGFLFARDNVAVSNGCLNLTARVLRGDERTVENRRRGFDKYATAIVKAKRKTRYGYYECRAKTMKACVCNAFWLYDPLSDSPAKFRAGDFSEEIDIFEIFGAAGKDEKLSTPCLRKCFHTVHRLATPYLEGICFGGVEKLPQKTLDPKFDSDFWADYHVFGFLWTERELVWFVDGKETFRRANDRFHRPLHLTFDCEIMFNWAGEPHPSDLPAVFSIDYFRRWEKL